jgi:hypothetical protein
MSVGDILVLECGWIYRCASFGFAPIPAWHFLRICYYKV